MAEQRNHSPGRPPDSTSTGAPAPVRVLLLEDSPLDAELVAERLDSDGLACAVRRVEDGPSFERALESERFDVVLSDYSLPTYDGLRALETTRRLCPDLPFIFVSGALGEERAIEAMHQGATDYVLKTYLGRLTPAIARALGEAQERNARRQAAELSSRLQALGEALARALTPTEVAEVAVEQGMAALAAGTGACWMFDEGEPCLRLVYARGYDAATREACGRLSLSAELPVTHAVRERALLWLESRGELAQRFPAVSQVTRGQPGDEAVACIPLLVGDAVVGALAFSFATMDCVAEGGRTLARSMGQHCAQALERARLFERARAQSQRFELLARASQALSSSFDYQATLASVAELCVPLLGDVCYFDIAVDDEHVQRIVRAPEQPMLAEQLARSGWVRWADPEVELCALSIGRTIHQPRVSQHWREVVRNSPAHRVLADELATCSLVSVPLVHRGAVLGALTVLHGPSRRAHSSADVELCEELARRAASAVEHSRLYEMAQKERARVEQANRAKDEFLAVVSHELRTPLQAMLGWARMLQSGRLAPEKEARALAVIERNAQLQSELIADLLDVARIASGKLQIEREPLSVLHVVESCVDAARPAASAKSIALESAIDDDATVLGDRTRLQQVLANLLTNAIKFTPSGGKVAVRVMVDPEHVGLSVSDSGQGIDPTFLPHLFERFRQASSDDARTHGGLGLGLAIVKHIVELHGGRITAHSEGRGHGATFSIRLPRRHDVPRHSAVTSSHASDKHQERLSGVQVLIVEDDADARELLTTVLENAHAAVTAVSSVREAISQLSEARPHVLVSDIGMPGETGYDLIREVRALYPGAEERIPAIALTAFARADDRTRALLMGFDAHLTKPVESVRLISTVASLLPRARGSDDFACA